MTTNFQCQRHGFTGPVIGPKPTEKNIREFTEEQMAAGKAIIGLQVDWSFVCAIVVDVSVDVWF